MLVLLRILFMMLRNTLVLKDSILMPKGPPDTKIPVSSSKVEWEFVGEFFVFFCLGGGGGVPKSVLGEKTLKR